MNEGYARITVFKKSIFAVNRRMKKLLKISQGVIEESNTDTVLLVNSFPGMLLPPFGDLSHTSILY